MKNTNLKAKQADSTKTIEQLASQLKEARDAIKKLEAQEKSIATQIKMFAEESETPVLVGINFVINLQERERSGLDSAKVASLLTESQLKECTKHTKYVQIVIAAK